MTMTTEFHPPSQRPAKGGGQTTLPPLLVLFECRRWARWWPPAAPWHCLQSCLAAVTRMHIIPSGSGAAWTRTGEGNGGCDVMPMGGVVTRPGERGKFHAMVGAVSLASWAPSLPIVVGNLMAVPKAGHCHHACRAENPTPEGTVRGLINMIQSDRKDGVRHDGSVCSGSHNAHVWLSLLFTS